jgi:hypothetical protein
MALLSLMGEQIDQTAPSRIASTLVAGAIVVVASVSWPSKSARHAVFE